MTRVTLEQLVAMIGGDRELVTVLVRERIITSDSGGFSVLDVDRVLAARTLIRELEVDIGAVEIILRLRAQLAQARRELAIFRRDDS